MKTKNHNPKLKSNSQKSHPRSSQRDVADAQRPRVGKIAQLPLWIRDELNRLLEDGDGGEELLQWLNGLAETRKLLKEEFDGLPISKQNLSDWRRGGYVEWLLRRDLLEQARAVSKHARDLKEQNSDYLADDLLTFFTARYAALLTRWDGEVTEQFSDKLRVFSRIRRDLLRLQEGALVAVANAREQDKLDQEERARDNEIARNEALAPFKAAERRNVMCASYGQEAGGKYADVLDDLDYADHPMFPTHFARSTDNQRAEQAGTELKPQPETKPAKIKATTKTNQVHQPPPVKPQPPESQAMPNSTQVVAEETIPSENADAESSQVKPLSAPPTEPSDNATSSQPIDENETNGGQGS
jgi:hypothetical protein